MNNVCAVVVTYNRLNMLKQCLSAISSQTVPCDLLVVNNASEDGTSEWLDSRTDQTDQTGFIHIQLQTNTGGAGGFNAGMREAVKRGYEYIWVMDDDVLPAPDALERILEADKLTGGRYGWLSSVTLWTDGTECKMNRQKLLKSFYQDIQLLQHGLVRAEQATFVSLFLKCRTVAAYGLPIRDFFIWGDDIEFTRRLAVRKELPCYVVGKSIVTHATKNNMESNIATDDYERISRYKLALRNENYFFRQEGIKGFCYYFARSGRAFLRCMRAKDHRLGRCGVVVAQVVSGLFFNPHVEMVE